MKRLNKKDRRLVEDLRNSLSDLVYLRTYLVKPSQLVKMNSVWRTAKERLDAADAVLKK